jgi:thioredoxin 1
MAQTKFAIEVNDQNFTEQVIKADEPVLVDFWAPWCPPCRGLLPTIESLAEQFQGRARVVKVNVDENAASSAKYGIKALPTLVLFNEGREIERQVGVPTNAQTQLAGLLESQLHQDCACAL